MTEGYDSVASLQKLKELITIECLGENLYRGCNLFQPKYLRALYGGQVASQALLAATKSISDLDSSFLIHSIHCYFISPSQASSELVYKVERIKAGKSFCTVSVQAVQQGRVMFHCLASFYKNDQENLGKELDYNRHPMPEVPHPNDDESRKSLSHVQLVNRIDRFGVEMEIAVDKELASEFRKGGLRNMGQVAWLRGLDTFTDDYPQNYHRISLLYLSDLWLAGLALQKFPEFKPGLVTSLDHSVWFHSPCKASQWFLFVSESERFTESRALSNRRIYTEDGTVVATVKQESLMRPKL